MQSFTYRLYCDHLKIYFLYNLIENHFKIFAMENRVVNRVEPNLWETQQMEPVTGKEGVLIHGKMLVAFIPA